MGLQPESGKSADGRGKYGLIRQAAAKIEWEELEDAGEEKDNLQDLAIEIGNVKTTAWILRPLNPYDSGQDRSGNYTRPMKRRSKDYAS